MDGTSTTPGRRGAALRRSANAFSTREIRERPSRRRTVMRLCTKQSANIRVTRRRSDLVSPPQPPPRGIEVLTTVAPYQLRFRYVREVRFRQIGADAGIRPALGRTLCDFALGRKTPLVELPWVGHQSPQWEREPMRWLGSTAARALLGSTDRADRRGRNYPIRERLLRAMDLDD